MPAENIFAQYAQPVRSVADYQDDYDKRDIRKLQLLGQQRQNAIADLTAQQTQQTMARNALVQAAQRKAAEAAGGDELAYAKNLRLAGLPELIDPADKVEKAITDRSKVGSENAGRDIETQNKAIAQWRDWIGQAASPQQAASLLEAMHADVRLKGTPVGSAPVSYSLEKLQSMPFEQWKQQFALGATKFVEMNKPTFVQRDSGGLLETLQQPGMGGAPVVVGSIKKTMTPGEVATNGLGYARLGEERRHNTATEGQAATVYDPERGVIVNKGNGLARSAVGLDGKPIGPKDKDLNDSQSKALLFGTRMQEADKILGELSQKGTDQPGMWKRSVEGTLGIVPQWAGGDGLAAAGGTLMNWSQSAEQQQVEQAQRDFVNAVLRRESGASISPTEFASAEKQYFPKPGDTDAVKVQKARNRALAIQGLLAEVPASKRQLPAASGGAAIAPGSVLKFDAQGNPVK